MSERVVLYNAEKKGFSPIDIASTNGDDFYSLLQIPVRLGIKLSDSELICVDGDELRNAISSLAEAAQRCYIRVIHTEIEASDNLPYIHFERSNIQIDGHITIRDFNLVDGRIVRLSVMSRKDSSASEILVRVGVGRGEFVVKAA